MTRPVTTPVPTAQARAWVRGEVLFPPLPKRRRVTALPRVLAMAAIMAGVVGMVVMVVIEAGNG